MAKVDSKTVEFMKTHVEPIAAKMKADKYSQHVHSKAVCIWFLNACGVKDAKLADAIGKKWSEVPSGFGANASQFNQAAGKPTAVETLEVSFSEFLNK